MIHARRDKRLLEGIGNSLILYVGLVFQQLESVQSMEDEMKDAKSALERVTQEKDQLVIFLEYEKAKVRSLR